MNTFCIICNSKKRIPSLLLHPSRYLLLHCSIPSTTSPPLTSTPLLAITSYYPSPNFPFFPYWNFPHLTPYYPVPALPYYPSHKPASLISLPSPPFYLLPFLPLLSLPLLPSSLPPPFQYFTSPHFYSPIQPHFPTTPFLTFPISANQMPDLLYPYYPFLSLPYFPCDKILLSYPLPLHHSIYFHPNPFHLLFTPSIPPPFPYFASPTSLLPLPPLFLLKCPTSHSPTTPSHHYPTSPPLTSPPGTKVRRQTNGHLTETIRVFDWGYETLKIIFLRNNLYFCALQ